MHKRKHTIIPVDLLLFAISRVVALFGLGHNEIYDFISEANFVWRFFKVKRRKTMRQSKRQAQKKVSSDEPLQPLLSIAEVCKMLRLSRPKIHDLIVHEGLPTIKFGRAVRISPTSLQHWLARREDIA